MRVLLGVTELVAGRELGRSDWVVVDPPRLDLFRIAVGRSATADQLALALIPVLSQQIWRIDGLTFAINAGLNQVRFLRPVEVGRSLQLRSTVVSVRALRSGAHLVLREELYDDAHAGPAVTAETVTLLQV